MYILNMTCIFLVHVLYYYMYSALLLPYVLYYYHVCYIITVRAI